MELTEYELRCRHYYKVLLCEHAEFYTGLTRSGKEIIPSKIIRAKNEIADWI